MEIRTAPALPPAPNRRQPPRRAWSPVCIRASIRPRRRFERATHGVGRRAIGWLTLACSLAASAVAPALPLAHAAAPLDPARNRQILGGRWSLPGPSAPPPCRAGRSPQPGLRHPAAAACAPASPPTAAPAASASPRPLGESGPARAPRPAAAADPPAREATVDPRDLAPAAGEHWPVPAAVFAQSPAACLAELETLGVDAISTAALGDDSPGGEEASRGDAWDVSWAGEWAGLQATSSRGTVLDCRAVMVITAIAPWLRAAGIERVAVEVVRSSAVVPAGTPTLAIALNSFAGPESTAIPSGSSAGEPLAPAGARPDCGDIPHTPPVGGPDGPATEETLRWGAMCLAVEAGVVDGIGVGATGQGSASLWLHERGSSAPAHGGSPAAAPPTAGVRHEPADRRHPPP